MRGGRLAARERGGANGEVGAGGAALEEWVDGELEARRRSGERRRCSGVWGRGNGAIVRGIGRGDPPGSDARERKGSWDSIRACHGDEDVAAGGGLWGAWQGEESSSAKARAVEKVGRDAWAASASRRWPPGGSRASAPTGKAEKQAGGGRRLDFFVISENSRDLTVKLK